MNIVTVEATDIPDAWFQCISAIIDEGFRYENQRGSYEGETRIEFDSATIYIRKPYREPYDLMLPQIPQHLGIPNPVADGYIEEYMPYLMTTTISPGENYTYGSRLYNQIHYWIAELRKTPITNQAIMTVGKAEDRLLKDPPCLRHIDMRIKKDELIFYPYFRSWDLWGGFPANLGAIAVLQKYMADEIGVDAGSIIAYSKGLHVYKYAEDLVKIRTGQR